MEQRPYGPKSLKYLLLVLYRVRKSLQTPDFVESFGQITLFFIGSGDDDYGNYHVLSTYCVSHCVPNILHSYTHLILTATLCHSTVTILIWHIRKRRHRLSDMSTLTWLVSGRVKQTGSRTFALFIFTFKIFSMEFSKHT